MLPVNWEISSVFFNMGIPMWLGLPLSMAAAFRERGGKAAYSVKIWN